MSLPETSVNPPLPLRDPPLAEILPSKVVVLSDQTITLPPLPLVRASALIVLFASTVVVCAVGVRPAPCKSPPINTVPPPFTPDALILALAKLTLVPKTRTLPPLFPDTSKVPDTLEVPTVFPVSKLGKFAPLNNVAFPIVF